MELSVNNRIYSLNIHKFSEILEILLQTCYNKPNIPGPRRYDPWKVEACKQS